MDATRKPQPTESRSCSSPSSADCWRESRPSVRPVGRPRVPSLETLEDRLVPTGDPFLLSDYFQVSRNTSLDTTVSSVLDNDNPPEGGTLIVSAVNGVAANVGQSVLLESGTTVTIAANGSLQITAALNFVGSESLTYTATAGGYTATSTISIVVMPGEENPISIAPISDQDNVEGDTVSLAVTASTTSTSSASLTFAATGLPDGLTMDSGTGVISGTIGPNTSCEGILATVTVTDGTSTATTSFYWAVMDNSLVTVADPGDQTSTEGDVISLQIVATTAGSSPLTYSANGLPPGLSIDEATGLITGTIGTWASDTDVTLTASDGTYSADLTFNWHVTSPISIALIEDQVNLEGDVISLQVNATAPAGMTLDYSAYNLPGGLTIDQVTGEISGTIEPDTARVAGVASVWVESTTASTYRQFAWTITGRVALAAIGDRHDLQGDTISLQLPGTSADENALTYSTTVLPAGLTLNAATGVITGTLSPTALGSSVTIAVTDGTYSATRTFLWAVTSPVTVQPIGEQYNFEGDTVSLSVFGSNAGTGGLTYTATGLPIGLTIDAATGLISGTVGYGTSSDTAVLIRVTVTDGTYSASTTFFWAISPRVSISTFLDQIGTEGDDAEFQIPVVRPAGTSLTYGVTGLPSGLTLNTETGKITGTFGAVITPENEPHSTEVTVNVTDGTTTSERTFRWTVLARRWSGSVGAGDDLYTVAYGGRMVATGEATSLPTLLLNDKNLGSGALTVTAVDGESASVNTLITLDSGSQVLIDVQGRVTYQAAAGFVGREWIEYTVANQISSQTAKVFFEVAAPAAGRTLVQALGDMLRAWSEKPVNDPGPRFMSKSQVDERVVSFHHLDQAPEAAAVVAILKMHIFQNGPDNGGPGEYARILGISTRRFTLTEDGVKILAAKLALPEDDPDGILARDLQREFEKLVQQANGFVPSPTPLDGVFEILLQNTLSLWGSKAANNELEKIRLSDAVQQGYLGDCSFMSALISYSRLTDPKTLKGRIEELAPISGVRQFNVKMYNLAGTEVKIPVQEPSYVQRLIYAKGADGTFWASLFERAYLQMRDAETTYGDYLKATQVVRQDWYYTKAELEGDTLWQAMKTLTRNSVKGESDMQPLPVLKKLFEDWSAKPFVFTVGKASAGLNPTPAKLMEFKDLGVRTQHAYAVIGYNTTSGMITLRNPHNNPNALFPFKGKDVELSIQQFKDFFARYATG